MCLHLGLLLHSRKFCVVQHESDVWRMTGLGIFSLSYIFRKGARRPRRIGFPLAYFPS
jgi:hypothetical protein